MAITTVWYFWTLSPQHLPTLYYTLAFICLGSMLWHILATGIRTYNNIIAVVASVFWLVTLLYRIVTISLTASSIIYSKLEHDRVIRLQLKPDRPVNLTGQCLSIGHLEAALSRTTVGRRRDRPNLVPPRAPAAISARFALVIWGLGWIRSWKSLYNKVITYLDV
jgi:hypothetical protein